MSETPESSRAEGGIPQDDVIPTGGARTMARTFVGGLLTGTAASLTCCAIYAVVNYKSNKQVDEYKTAVFNSLEDVEKLKKSRQILKYGAPDRGPVVRIYNDHALAYDQAKKTPIWVAEHLQSHKLSGKANRKKSHFKPDPEVHKQFSAVNEDYWKSGWSRGHMAPAGNYKYHQLSMNETFYLTNILPQDLDNNAGFWNRFEIYCRDLTKKFHDVRIISGPVMLPELAEDGKLYVKYQVIGQNQVAVPTHLYKVIVAESDSDSSRYVGAFIVPNKPIGYQHKLQEYQVDLEKLEKSTGITFLPELEKSLHSSLCEHEGCEMMSRDTFELYMTGRRVEGARNVNQLEKTWTEFNQKDIQPDDFLLNLYQNKKNELLEKEKKKSEL